MHTDERSRRTRSDSSAPRVAAPVTTGKPTGRAGWRAVLAAGFGVPIRAVDALRGLVAVALAITADVHFVLWYHDDFRVIPRIGVLFLLNAVAGVLLAVLVVAWRSWLACLLAAGFGAMTLGAFYLSTTVGLFGLHETARGGPQLHAESAEWVMVVLGLAAAVLLLRHDLRQGDTRQRE